MRMRLMSKGEYLIVPKGTKFTGSGKLGLRLQTTYWTGISSKMIFGHVHEGRSVFYNLF